MSYFSMLLGAVEIPFIILVTISMDRIGRRLSLVVSLLAAAACCFTAAVVAAGGFRVAVAVLGKGVVKITEPLLHASILYRFYRCLICADLFLHSRNLSDNSSIGGTWSMFDYWPRRW